MEAKKYFILLLFIGVSFSFNCTKSLFKSNALAEEFQGNIAFDEIKEGVDWYKGDVEFKSIFFSLSIARIDTKKYSVEIDHDPNLKGFSVCEYQKRNNGLIALSGGFLKSFHPPLPIGLVKRNGEIVNRPAKSDFFSGVFCSKNNKVIITHYYNKDSLRNWSNCLQSGPLLLYEGKSALKVNDYPERFLSGTYRRAFVGIDRKDRLLLAITGRISIPDLISFLEKSDGENGLNCMAALNLTGINLGMIIEANNKTFFAGDINFYPANAIVVKEYNVLDRKEK